jgi:hypothetical protein
MELKMQYYFKQRKATSALIVCFLTAYAWMDLAYAAKVKVAAPRRPVASESIVVAPGEPEETRRRWSKKREKILESKRDQSVDKSASDDTAPAAPSEPAGN